MPSSREDMEKRRPRKEGEKWGGSEGDARRILNLLDERVADDGADEIRQLGDAFNSIPNSAARSVVKLLLHATTGIPNARARGIIS
mgnify:CR=1 FL=1